MNAEVKGTIEDVARRSHEGSVDFGTVVATLAAVGVESYLADYRRRETVYYLPTGETLAVPLPTPDLAIADGFDAGGVSAAVRGAQRGEVKYPAFMQRTMSVGCVGYFVWIAGRHVQYLGRCGEVHVEHFPARP